MVACSKIIVGVAGVTPVTCMFSAENVLEEVDSQIFQTKALARVLGVKHRDITQDIVKKERINKTGLFKLDRATIRYIFTFLNVRKGLVGPDVDPNLSDIAGRTLLTWAARLGKLLAVEALLQHEKIDVNVRDRNRHTPLCVSCQRGNLAIVKLLLEHKNIDVNQQDRSNSPLFLACRIAEVQIVKELLSHEEIDVNSFVDGLRTPLMQAAEFGHIEMVKALLADEYMDVTVITHLGRSALWDSQPSFNPSQIQYREEIAKLIRQHPSAQSQNF